eukprot:6174878-Prorocentrum_lima.AAC.1
MTSFSPLPRRLEGPLLACSHASICGIYAGTAHGPRGPFKIRAERGRHDVRVSVSTSESKGWQGK